MRHLRRHCTRNGTAPEIRMSVFGAVNFSTWSPGNSLGDYVDEASHQEIAIHTVAGPEEVGTAYGMSVPWNFLLNPAESACLADGGVGSFATALLRATDDVARLSTPMRRVVIEDGTAQGVVALAGIPMICTGNFREPPCPPPRVRRPLGSLDPRKCVIDVSCKCSPADGLGRLGGQVTSMGLRLRKPPRLNWATFGGPSRFARHLSDKPGIGRME